jgi:flagellin-like protein
MESDNRGVSSAIATILMVAVVVILAATISVSVFVFGEDIRSPSPVVGQSTGDIDPNPGGSGGIITVTHMAGDPVEVKNIQILIDATDACNSKARVINLPADYSFSQFDDDVHFRGDTDILNQEPAPTGKDWDGGVLLEENDNTFSAGDSFQLQLSAVDCPLNGGEQIEINIVHTPTDSIILSEELTV